MNYLDIQLKLTVFLVLYLKFSVVSSYPPTFAEEPKNRTINAGSGALFRCKADGRPTPRVTVSSWLKDGQPLSQRDLSSGRLKVYTSSGSLQFVRTRREDSGNYTCVIRNTQGVNTSSAILVVKGMSLGVTETQRVYINISSTIHSTGPFTNSFFTNNTKH